MDYQQPSPGHRRLVPYVVGLGALATVIILFIVFSFGSGVPSGRVFATVGLVKVTALHELSGDQFSPVVVQGAPAGTFVTDMVRGEGSTYYLMIDADRLGATLYALPDGGALTPLTTSKTIKFDLAYDATAGRLTYLSGTLENPDLFINKNDWAVTTLPAAGGAEKVYPATGNALVLVPGTAFAYVRSGNQLRAVDIDSGIATDVLSIHPQAPFAVDGEGVTVALYNLVTSSADMFDISAGPMAPSYLRSEPIEKMPSTFGYSGKDLFAVTQTDFTSFLLQRVGGGVSPMQSPHPDAPMAVQKIIFVP